VTDALDARLDDEFHRLVRFGGADVVGPDGAVWLDDDGRPTPGRPALTYATARMAHVHALAALAGVAGSGPVADALLDRLLRGPLHDDEHGGWHHAVPGGDPDGGDPDGGDPDGGDPDGGDPDGWDKTAYDQAFVLLAAATAVVAGRPDGPALLDAARAAHERFVEPGTGLVADAFDRTWTRCEPYRGLNATMHTVEALLAVADATGDPAPRARALHLATATVGRFGPERGWRLVEHFSPDWEPRPEHHRDRPDDPFRPYGATVGHGLEWSRLLLALAAGTAQAGEAVPEWLTPAAVALYDRAVTDGWAVDGADGFVYTTDWSGAPVVHDRMHWVVAEAVAAAAALHAVTGDARYAADRDRFWAFADDHHVDRARGSWVHQLDRRNRPAATVWPGKPDLYHAVQATLLPRLPLAPGLAVALRRGGGSGRPGRGRAEGPVS
jgi:mannose/cellobiose epimerase-like protein (N-acyl-D-glucosamine 2-epimerase family)